MGADFIGALCLFAFSLIFAFMLVILMVPTNG
jgi:hypothetical protein